MKGKMNMRLFGGIFNGLRGSVGQNLENDPDDIKKTELALNQAGYFKGGNAIYDKIIDYFIRKIKE